MEINACYKTLGLPPDASLADAKQAYRKLVNRWHPDRFAQNDALYPLAVEQLKLFNSAYATVKKEIAARPRSYGHRPGAPLRAKKADTAPPGLRNLRPAGSGGPPAVLNRLTLKFRRFFSAFLYAPGRPARIWKRYAAPSAANPSNRPENRRDRPKVNPRKNFDDIFNEVAGPEAAQMKAAAALKKEAGRKRTSGQNASSGAAAPAAGKSRAGNSEGGTPILRVKRVGKIRRI